MFATEEVLKAVTRRTGPCAVDPPKPSFGAIDNNTFREKNFSCATKSEQFPALQTLVKSWWFATFMSGVSGIPVHESSRQCLAPVMLHAKHVLSVAVKCESGIHRRVFQNGQTAFGNKSQEVLECLLVKFPGSQGTQGTVFQDGC